jgi:hypothetical protein
MVAAGSERTDRLKADSLAIFFQWMDLTISLKIGDSEKILPWSRLPEPL